MKNNRGVTLSSLTIYIIVLMIILVAFTFVSSNFTSQISEVTERGKTSNECTKIYSYLVKDIKAANRILEYDDHFIRFDNDVKYQVKYLGVTGSGNRQRVQYEVYRNNVLIAENMMDVNFNYQFEKNVLSVSLKYYYGKSLNTNEQTFLVGRGY